MNKKKVIISSNSGFCFGVRRALDMANDALKEGKTVYSLGPIIHNPQVIEEFSKKGLKVVTDTAVLKGQKSVRSKVLIPSHGISPITLKKIKQDAIDTTCPLVNRVQRIVQELRSKGYFIIIVGDKKHPEVKGLKGIAGKKCKVIKNEKEAADLNIKAKKVALISQTTAPLSKYNAILKEISNKKIQDFVSCNTVCRNTIDRRKEAEEIAREVDAMIIIGGKNSANTTKLAKACKSINKHTYHIESEKDLNKKVLNNKNKIGIATGASTPPYAIREVVKIIKEDR